MDEDDLRGPIEGRARFHRPYLGIAVVAVLAVSIVGLGFLGPHPPPRAIPSPTAPPAVGRTPAGPAAPSPVVGPSPGANDAVAGLTEVDPLPGQMLQSRLPLQVAGSSFAAIGIRLFYVFQGDRIESTEIGSAGDPQVLVSVPRCEAINQLAAAGHEVAYVVTSPDGLSAIGSGCGGNRLVSWSLWLLDLNGGSPRQVAHGTRVRSSVDVGEYPIHLALTDSAYAFDRPATAPDSGGAAVVEVHSLSGALLWTSHSPSPVSTVMLAGGKLAVLTDGSAHGATGRTLWIADATHPALADVAQPASSASISPDGSYLAWDLPPDPASDTVVGRSAVDIDLLASGRVQALAARTAADMPGQLRPSISMTRAGPAIAWLATAPGGAEFPAFRFAGGGDGGFLSSAQAPVWLNVQGGELIWVAESTDGWSASAYAVDLIALASD